MNQPQIQNKKQEANKGISLIIAVFAIMLFSVLGWTLVKIQSTDFESNVSTGNLNSERALNLAEAGAEWTLQRLSLNGGFRTDTTNGYPLGYAQHSISPGQYRVSCLDGTGDDFGLVIITSNGYIPSASSYNTTRQVRLKIQVGSLTKAVMTQAADPDNQNVGLFDWSLANAGHTVTINGDISAGHYSGDGDANPDEANQDYGTAPMLPPGAAGSKRDFTATYPAIDMKWFHDNATTVWPASNIDIDNTISSTANGDVNTSCIRTDDSGFFNNMNSQAIRLSAANLDDLDNQDNWRRIVGLNNGPGPNACCPGPPDARCARVRPRVSAAWSDEASIKLMRRFGSGATGASGDIWYIGRQRDGGQTMETIIDVNAGDLSLDNRYIISEGNIYIKGQNSLSMGLTGSIATTRYPRLATQNGGIVSPDTPSAATEAAKAGQRVISGLIYSELGEIKLHYLRPPGGGTVAYRGNLVYGKRATLDGRIIINYLPGLVSTNGFTFVPATKSWDEE